MTTLIINSISLILLFILLIFSFINAKRINKTRGQIFLYYSFLIIALFFIIYTHKGRSDSLNILIILFCIIIPVLLLIKVITTPKIIKNDHQVRIEFKKMNCELEFKTLTGKKIIKTDYSNFERLISGDSLKEKIVIIDQNGDYNRNGQTTYRGILKFLEKYLVIDGSEFELGKFDNEKNEIQKRVAEYIATHFSKLKIIKNGNNEIEDISIKNIKNAMRITTKI